MSTPPPDDPRVPPRPPADDPDAPGTPLRAIFTGLAIDVGGSFVVDLVAGTLYVMQVTTSGMSDDQVTAALALMPAQSGFAVTAMLGRALCSVIAGYACSRVIQRDEFRIGALMSVILALLSLLAGGDGSDDMLTLGVASTLACNLLGVKYGLEANERRRAKKATAAVDPQQP